MATKTNTFALLLFCLFTVILCHRHPPFRRPKHHRDIHAQFKKFHHAFRRPYRHGTQEYLQRFEAFKINLGLIDKFNSQRKHNSSARYGITKFSDLTPNEFKAKYLSSLHHTVRPTLLYSTQKAPDNIKDIKKLPLGKIYDSNSVLKAPPVTTIPSGLPLKVDLRGKNVLGPIRNQKSCGGCWAFSVVEMVETIAALQSMVQVPLSVQEVIDCSKSFGDLWGCKGGDTCNALKWLNETHKPLVPEEKYPLDDESQPCQLPNSTKTGVQVVDYTCEELSKNEEKIQLYLATQGPVSVSVDATTWNNYMGGIIQFHCGESPNNHAVVIVGYDKTGDIPFYIVKNSWGPDFGDKGYMYIMMGSNVCGIAHEVSTVKVKM